MSGAGPAKCERCFKTVFAAEAIRLDGRTFHKSCFNCEECNRKLTLTTFYKTHGIPALFCQKCGPRLVPTLSIEDVAFRREKIAQGLARNRTNDQVRGVGTRRPASFYREKTDGGDKPALKFSPGKHTGDDQNTGYHSSGQPIYGNLPGYYSQNGVERDDSAFITEDAFLQQLEADLMPPEELDGAPIIPERRPVKGLSSEKKKYLERASRIYNNDVAAGLSKDPVLKPQGSQKIDSGPNIAAMEDEDYGQPCMKCKTCPGFILHPWRKNCQMCGCPRTNHRSKEVTRRREALKNKTGKVKYLDTFSWVPADCEESLIRRYFNAIPKECIPIIGSEGEIWRHEQLMLQLPKYDTDAEFSSRPDASHIPALEELDDIRLAECFDVGQVLSCPDFARPGDCSECGCNSEGYHWAYCSRFIEHDPSKLKTGRKKSNISRKTSTDSAATADTEGQQNEFIQGMYPDQNVRSIKDLRLKVRGSTTSSASAAVASKVAHDAVEEEMQQRLASGKCHGCMQELYVGEPVVGSGRFGDELVYFHPKCFTCSDCGELLVDNRSFVDVGKEERGASTAEKRLFCGRHWNDNRFPRCAACDETCFSEEYVYEFGRPYHLEHFCCTICDTNLTTVESFVPRGRKPYCFPCYGVHFADKCTVCQKPINPSPGFGGKVSVSGKHWHGYCFRCKVCDQDMAGKPAIPKADGLYCKPCLKEKKKDAKRRDRDRKGSSAMSSPATPKAAPIVNNVDEDEDDSDMDV